MRSLAIRTRYAHICALLLWLLLLVLGSTRADAYVLNKVRLRTSPTASRLILSADAAVKFRVDLAGPQAVVLHLPGANMSTDLPPVEKDPLIAAIKTQIQADGLSLLIQTRTPGITVLPSYEAISHTLTLEFGGPPTYEQAADEETGLPPADPDLSLPPPEPGPKVVTAPVPALPQEDQDQPVQAEPVPQESDRPAAQNQPAPEPVMQDPEPEPAPLAGIGSEAPPEPAMQPDLAAQPESKIYQASGLIPPPPPLDEPQTQAASAMEQPAQEPQVREGAAQTIARVPVPPPPEPEPAEMTSKPQIQTGQNVTFGHPQDDGAKQKPQETEVMQPAPEPATPAQTVEKAPETAAAEAAQPAPAAPPVPQTPAPQVLRIRRGTHPDYTRVVLDGDGPMTAHLLKEEQRIILSLERGDLAEQATVARPDRRTSSIRVIQKSPLRLEIGLKGWLGKHKLFYLTKGRKVVLDFEISDQPPLKPEPEPKPLSAATPQPGDAAAPPAPAPAPQPAVKPAPQPIAAPVAAVAAQPTVTPARQTQAQAKPETPEPKEPAAQSYVQKPIERPRAARPGLKDLAAKPPLEVPMATRARVNPRFRTFAQGSIPPVPPPPPLARPRGPIVQNGQRVSIIGPTPTVKVVQPRSADAGAPQAAASAGLERPEVSAPSGVKPGLAGGKIPPPPDARQVIQKVADAGVQTAGQAPKPAPQVVASRPPQAAILGAAGREDVEATRMFEQAKAQFDSRRYQQALEQFTDYLQKFPKHRLAPEATFRLADAYFNLHERNFQAYYPEAMRNYQKGIDLYPESDQVPWALLMMGRAAMLGGEPFKAAGYFEVVIQDYPKSEYVPLALVQRAQAYMAEGKLNRALEEFRQVSERFPGSRYRKDADWGQAQALFNMSRYQRASLLLKDMDRRDPDLRIKEPELLYYIGEAEFQQKHYPEARSYFLWALNIMPNLPDKDIVLTRVGDTYKFENDHAAAKDIYRRVVNMFPDTDGALVSRIRLAESPARGEEHPWEIFKVQATTDAFKTYREIATRYPDREVSELARLKLGVYHYKKKQYEEAMDSLLGLLKDNPRTIFKPQIDYTANLITLGMLEQYHQQGRPMELMNVYLQYRGSLTRPNGDTVLGHLAWAYEQNGWYKRAAKLYETLMKRGGE